MELDNLNMNDSKIGRELVIQQISKEKTDRNPKTLDDMIYLCLCVLRVG